MDEPRSPGQPTKCTPEAKEKMLYAISKGAPYQLACDYAGVSYRTFLNWKARAEEENLPDYVQFFQDLKTTQGATAVHWLEKIDEAMEDGTWTAAAWKLERRQGRYFAPQSAIIDANERIDKIEEGNQSERRKGRKEERETTSSGGETKDNVTQNAQEEGC